MYASWLSSCGDALRALHGALLLLGASVADRLHQQTSMDERSCSVPVGSGLILRFPCHEQHAHRSLTPDSGHQEELQEQYRSESTLEHDQSITCMVAGGSAEIGNGGRFRQCLLVEHFGVGKFKGDFNSKRCSFTWGALQVNEATHGFAETPTY